MYMETIRNNDISCENSLDTAKEKLFTEIEKRTRECTDPKSPIPGFRMYRRNEVSQLNRYTHEPSLCFVVQGAKHILLGTDEYSYNRDSYLITSVDLPIVAQIVEASPEKPYMGFALKLNQKDIAHMLAEGHLKETDGETKSANRAMTVSSITEPLISAFLRLIALLDEPEAIPFLAPAIEREILYRVLTSEGGKHLRQIGVRGSQSAQILRAIDWLKNNFSQTLSVEELANHSQMSLSAFHHHFRSITAMSPLQYQKWLRLQDARRLMLTENCDATRAAFKVGYESSSQFCREYGRLFGVSPAKDIRLIKQASTG